MFLGRTRELETLQALYERPGFQMVVLYGRRRVGKTSLIAEFLRDKPHLFYVAIEQSDRAALQSFWQKATETFPDAPTYATTFDSWETAFEFLADRARETRIAVAIDEYPYLAAGNASISSTLQRSIDMTMQRGNLFLILCGSSMSFMERQVLGYQSPLYGRRTAQYRIEPFDYADGAAFFPDWSWTDRMIAYGAVGGIPQYLSIIARESSLERALARNLFSVSGALYEEPSSLLKQELREPAMYNSVIAAIASGASRFNEIVTRVGEDGTKIGRYLNTLIDLHIVRREQPFGQKNTRKTLYSLTDNLFRFWYRFVPPNVSNIEAGLGEQVFHRRVVPHIPEYMGRIFEDICMQYIRRLHAAGALPFWIDDIGRWWGNDPVRRREDEIDFIAAGDASAIFGECKWRGELTDVDVLDTLIRRAALLPQFEERVYAIASRSGFTDRLQASAAERGDVMLIAAEEMLGAM